MDDGGDATTHFADCEYHVRCYNPLLIASTMYAAMTGS